MLPAHLRLKSHEADDNDTTTSSLRYSDRPRTNNNNAFLATHASSSPPIGLTGVICEARQLLVPRGSLHYTVFRPRQMQAGNKPPLVCIAGGPLLPCNYLHQLVHLIVDRAIVFYDQLGAGQSKVQGNHVPVDINGMVEDLAALIDELHVTDYHLLGHSFGGILAYEYLLQRKRHDDGSANHTPTCICRSVTLSNTPVSVADALAACHDCMELIRRDMPAGTEEDDLLHEFTIRHECFLDPLPLPLQQSFQMAAFASKKGLQLVRDYQPKVLTKDSSAAAAAANNKEEAATADFPPALVLCGSRDYCQPQGWVDVLLLLLPPIARNVQVMTLANCGHYGLLENEELFGSVLNTFVQAHDPALPPLVLPNGVVVRR